MIMSQRRFRWLQCLTAACGFLVIPILWFTFFTACHVIGSSMEPTLHEKDCCLIRKTTDVHYGDIVIFAPYGPNDEGFIKRVIALGGDTLTIEDGQVIRNGELLEEPYVQGETLGSLHEIVIPQGHMFVMGDNRSHSADSRLQGPAPVESVIGVVWLTW